MARVLFLFLFVVRFSLVAGAAEKVNPYEVPESSALENRQIQSKNDISLNFGVLPLDAFYKAATVGLKFSQKLSPLWSWEFLDLESIYPQNTTLKNELIDKFSAQPEGILETPKFYATTSFVYTPIYSKSLIFNKDVLHSEISFLGSGGAVQFSKGDTSPMFGGGILMRFFQSPKVSYKLDSRLFYHSAKGKSSHFLLNIGLSVTYEFGEGAKKDALQ